MVWQSQLLSVCTLLATDLRHQLKANPFSPLHVGIQRSCHLHIPGAGVRGECCTISAPKPVPCFLCQHKHHYDPLGKQGHPCNQSHMDRGGSSRASLGGKHKTWWVLNSVWHVGKRIRCFCDSEVIWRGMCLIQVVRIILGVLRYCRHTSIFIPH